MNNLFRGLFDSSTQNVISVSDFLLCIGVSILIGIFLAAIYQIRCESSQSFVMTLGILPAVVCVVIMMVNGNVGAGVAVAGTFSLVRFRSAQGTAREICAIFIAMSAGLITGMGYLAYGVLFTVIVSLLMLCYQILNIGQNKNAGIIKTLQITIPENLDYADVFEDIMTKYTRKAELVSVKTANMGSIFKLQYDVELITPSLEKEFLDKIRVRNGNLDVSISRRESEREMPL